MTEAEWRAPARGDSSGAALLVCVVCSLVHPSRALGDALDDIAARGFFTWGADEEGGGPYVYPDPADPSRRTGFEVDLASLLAEDLSSQIGTRVEARFYQGQWDKLPDLLRTGRIDMVLNGYEWSPERASIMGSTVPYYIYELQLLARVDDSSMKDWESLLSRPRTVGVLGGSAADRYLRENHAGGGVEIVSYNGSTDSMGDVIRGRLDATLQDIPPVVFFRNEFPGLRAVGDPVAPGRYVIFVKKGDERLRTALDRAITWLRARGELRRVYERYGLWNKRQEDAELLSLPDPALPGPALAGDGAGAHSFLARHGRTFLEAAGMTILLAVLSMPLAMALGLLVALGRLWGPRPVSFLFGLSVEVLRGTPLMLQLYVIFYVLPLIGIQLPAVAAGVLGLAINYSAYEAEIYRSGIQAVPLGQMEAALALGMRRGLAFRRVILPQAWRIVIPPVTNDFIALFKDTSVCSVITVVELTKRYNIAAMNSPVEVLPLAAVAAGLYLAMSYPLSVLAALLERKLRP
ncbi:MAG TPA: ABC transporter substrate-binding protein/permease [Planctomycetota bacterium]|nr:ABC transporter substrate-binding protein/permease [Planctomycetota bacterium]